ncbi:protease [Penaeus vannamei]|uniref:Protease n=1 Tax=Penaeus vannamei TaxID=6689 RepID=A0A423T528_PENVA|nr:protease [Penaeus vannamei]
MNGPSVRVFVTLASATAFLLSILTPIAHAAQNPSLPEKWSEIVEASKINMDYEKIFPKVISNVGNPETNQGCGGTADLDAGDVIIFYSQNDGTKSKCKYTFKSPAGTYLAMACPQFNLNPAGCKAEKLTLKITGARPVTYCEDEEVSVAVPRNSLKVTYKRKALGKGQCSGGFVCLVGAIEVNCNALASGSGCPSA